MDNINKLAYILSKLHEYNHNQNLHKQPIENSNVEETYYSKGIHNIGIKNVITYLDEIIKITNIPNIPIISVGSGSGCVERRLNIELKTDIICVDPLIETFILTPKKFSLEPKYSYVKDLIKDNPTVVGNCILFLNWSTPNESDYDYDALELLKSKHVLWVGDTSGTSAGYKFHNWLKKCNIDITNEMPYIETNVPIYHEIKKMQIEDIDMFGIPVYYTLLWLSKSVKYVNLEICDDKRL